MVCDTITAFTGGLGTGKTFRSVEIAVKLLKRNRSLTRRYNRLHPHDPLPEPQLYSSIPLLLSRSEFAVKLMPDHLTLQSTIIPGSVVFIDEIDVWANQFSFGNENIIDTPSKKSLSQRREGDSDYDTGLFDEEIRLFRHLFSSAACEAKLVCNSQATSNICTIVRRRMNVVYVLARFRIWFGLFYTVRSRSIIITDEIVNTNAGLSTEDTKLKLGLVPRFRRYDTHCYRSRYKRIPDKLPVERWEDLTTDRLMKCPIDRLKNPCN